MNRRGFLTSTGIAVAGLAFPKVDRLLGQTATSGGWRTFEVTTRAELLKYSGTTRIWLPAALTKPTPFQRTLANTFDCKGGIASMIESDADSLAIVAAEFPAG